MELNHHASTTKETDSLEKIIYTLIIAIIGGLIGMKLKIPAGALIGSMIFVAIFNICCEKGELPANFRVVAQILVGGLIGLSFSRESLIGLKELIGPAILLTVGLLVFCILLGYLISKFTGMDLMTALFSSAPGGLSEMTLISEAYGADISKVILLQLTRMILVITVLPFIIGFLSKYLKN